MKQLLLSFCVFVAFTAAAQKAAVLSLPIKADVGNEKLVFPEGKLLFFRNTPMHLLKGYELLFYNTPNAVGGLDPDKRTYTCRWVIDNDKIYLEKCYVLRLDPINGLDNVPADTDKEEIEHFTKQKFDDKGHLHAKWVTGKLPVYGVQTSFFYNGKHTTNKEQNQKKHLDSLHNHQTYYLAHFKKGKLLKIEEADKDWNPKK